MPPTIHYGRDAGGDTELFANPVTIANDGARSAAVLSIELEVQNLKTNATKRYYSAFLGEHPREATTPNRQFAPLSIAGRGPVLRHRALLPSGRCKAQAGRCTRASTPSACSSTRPPRKEASLLDRLQGRTQLAPVDLPDDAAMDFGSAARPPARHDRHARQGLEARGGSGQLARLKQDRSGALGWANSRHMHGSSLLDVYALSPSDVAAKATWTTWVHYHTTALIK